MYGNASSNQGQKEKDSKRTFQENLAKMQRLSGNVPPDLFQNQSDIKHEETREKIKEKIQNESKLYIPQRPISPKGTKKDIQNPKIPSISISPSSSSKVSDEAKHQFLSPKTFVKFDQKKTQPPSSPKMINKEKRPLLPILPSSPKGAGKSKSSLPLLCPPSPRKMHLIQKLPSDIKPQRSQSHEIKQEVDRANQNFSESFSQRFKNPFLKAPPKSPKIKSFSFESPVSLALVPVTSAIPSLLSQDAKSIHSSEENIQVVQKMRIPKSTSQTGRIEPIISGKLPDQKKESTQTQAGHSQDNVHWYTDDEMDALLKNYVPGEQIELLDAMLGTNLGRGNDLAENLSQFQAQRTQAIQDGHPVKNIVLIPVNLHRNHWALLYIIYQRNAEQLPLIYYFDPLGNAPPEDLQNALRDQRLFPALLNEDVIAIGGRVQQDGYNCGPWVVEAAKYIARNGAIPDADLDISAARRRHMVFLNDEILLGAIQDQKKEEISAKEQFIKKTSHPLQQEPRKPKEFKFQSNNEINEIKDREAKQRKARKNIFEIKDDPKRQEVKSSDAIEQQQLSISSQLPSPKSPKLPKLSSFQTVNPQPLCLPKRKSPKLENISQTINEQYSELNHEKRIDHQHEIDSKYAIHGDDQISPNIKKPEEKIIVQSQSLEISKDIKNEDIEVNIAQLRRLSQHKSRLLIDLIKGHHYEIDYYLKLKSFLDSLNLTKEEVKDLYLKELDQLVNQNWWGKFLNAYASNHVFFKIFAFWLLDEAGIKLDKLKQADVIGLNAIALDEIVVKNFQGKAKENNIGKGNQNDKNDIKPSSNISHQSCFYSFTQCLENLKQYLSTRVWPKNRILLFEDIAILAKAHSIEAATKSLKWFNKMWAALITSLLVNDIYFYYAYPEQRYDNTLYKILTSRSEHTKMLSSSLISVTVWPELIAFPSFLLITEALWKRFHPSHSIETKDIPAIQEYWNNYKPTLKQDLFYPLLSLMAPSFLSKFLGLTPFPTTEYNYNNLLKTLLWDGQVKAKDRLEIFQGLKTLLNKSSKLTHINVLALLEALAEHIHSQDIQRLHKKGYDKNTIKALLQIQSESLLELKKQTKWNGIGSIFFLLYAHFLLWNIGQSETNIAQPYFLAFQTYRWYATIRFFMTLVEGIKRAIDLYLAKKACEAEGKLWIYMNQVADYKCTVCGDLPIYYGSIFTSEDCIKVWFETITRTPQELIDFAEGKIGKYVNFDSMGVLNFNKQYLHGESLTKFLAALKKRATNLNRLNLQMIGSSSLSNNINSTGIQGIASLLNNSVVQELNLSWQFRRENPDLEVIGRILSYSQLRFLDLSWNGITNDGVTDLCQGLSRSMLQRLNLEYNKIEDEGIKNLAAVLNMSHLEELKLKHNNIGNEGMLAIGQKLNSSLLRTLTLDLRYVETEGMNGIVKGLQGSKLEALTLEGVITNETFIELGIVLNNTILKTLSLTGGINDYGVKFLAQGLSGSQLQTLGLADNNIGDLGIKELASKLNSSNLESLDISSNKIGDEGIIRLSQNLKSSKLKSLFLSFNSFGDIGLMELGRKLNDSSLEMLILGSSLIGDEGIVVLGQGLNSSLLQTLQLYVNNIGDEGTIALGQGLVGSKLQNLDFFANISAIGGESLGRGLRQSMLESLNLLGISDEGLKEFAQGLSGSTLKYLDLGFSPNIISDEGAKALGQALSGSMLEYLNLYSLNIKDEGAKALGEGLSRSKLKWLNLMDNYIGDLGAEELSQQLPNSVLEYLSLDGNEIGDNGAIAIANILATSSIKQPANLWIREWDPNIKRSISRYFEPNTKLKELNLGSNDISDIGARALCKVLPTSGISVENYFIYWNNFDNKDLETCAISAASHHNLPLLFRLVEKLFRSIKEIIWPERVYLQIFNRPKLIFTEGINDSKKNRENVDSFINDESINDRNELLNTPVFQKRALEFWNMPNVNYQSNHHNFHVVSLSQSQVNNTIPPFLIVFILGIMLLWIYKKIFAFKAENKTTYQHKKIHRRNSSIANLSCNPNIFWSQLKSTSSHLTQQLTSDAILYHR